MKDYKLSQEELDKIQYDSMYNPDYGAGYRDAEDRLIPILEEKDERIKEMTYSALKAGELIVERDKLLEECKPILASVKQGIAGWLTIEKASELLQKL